MNTDINARKRERIRSSDEPLADTFEELDDFADRVGGFAWRAHRARAIRFARSVYLYLDEDFERLSGDADPDEDELVLDDAADEEKVYVGFEARRVLGDEPGDGFSSVYEIIFSHSLPLRSTSDIPEPYRELVNGMMSESSAEEDENDADLALAADASNQSENINDLTEERTTTYTLYSDDRTVDYEYDIRYIRGEEYVDGPRYDSGEPAANMVSPSDEEYVVDRGPLTAEEIDQVNGESTIEMLGQELAYEENMLRLEGRAFDGIELVAHSTHDHAKRVMALIGILKSGIYVRPFKRKE